MENLTVKNVLRFIFFPTGRLKRLPFLLAELLIVLIFFLIGKEERILALDTFDTNRVFLFLGSILLIGWVHFVLTIKRLHDVNLSGWVSLINCVPFVNFFFLLFLIFKGSVDPNKYEITPRRNPFTDLV